MKKILNHIFIDGLSGMALGLFSTLIIGTIIGQIGTLVGNEIGTYLIAISSVAKIMNKTVNSISTSRAQLISKGIIYSVRYKELDFTVPEFDAYVRRLEEYREWKKENKIR